MHPVHDPEKVVTMPRSQLQSVGFSLPGPRADALNMLGARIVHHLPPPHGCPLDAVSSDRLAPAVEAADKLRDRGVQRARIEALINAPRGCVAR